MAALVATVLAAELGARALAPNLDPVYRWPNRDYVDHEAGLARRADDLQVLVVGSSTVGRAIRPDALAAAGGPGPGYNFWLAGPPLRSIDELTTRVLLDRVAPAVVIIGVTMRELNDSPAARTHLQAQEASSAFRAATGQRRLLGRLDDILRDTSDLARYRATLRDPSALVADLRRPQPVPEHLADDGFLLDRGAYTLADETPAHLAQERQAMAGYTVDPDDVAALGHLVDHVHRQGATALVVNLPVTEQLIDLADGGRADYDTYLSQVEGVTTANGGRWLDAMAATTWPEEYFGDIDHLNDRGAERLQPLVVDVLAGIPPTATPPTASGGS